MTRRRWLITTVAVVWALVLVVAALWSSRTDPPTVREQSELAQGRQALDAAVETLQTAAGAGVVTDVHDYQVGDCRLSVAWGGTEVDRVIVLTVPAGQEPALLDKLVQRLPEQWQARHHPNTSRLVADAGDFVAVRGEVSEAGQVRLTVSTGCRPGTDPELGG